MRILLHICCAPCALYTVDRLRQQGHKVEGFFYNPNIAPLAEYKLRRQAVVEMAKRTSLRVTYGDDKQQSRAGCSQGRSARSSGAPHSKLIFCADDFVVGPSRKKSTKPCSQPALVAAKQRCVNCWFLRLAPTAQMAKQTGVDAFSTTLLISPYQNHDQIRIIGDELGKEEAVDFYYEDFRVGFRQSQQMAKEQGLYRQKYCGCMASIEEASGRK